MLRCFWSLASLSFNASLPRGVHVFLAPSLLIFRVYSLLATRYSPLATHYSIFSIHYSQFTTYYSLFATRYSLLTIHYRLLCTLHSSLCIPISPSTPYFLHPSFYPIFVFYSLLSTFYSLHSTLYSPLSTRYFPLFTRDRLFIISHCFLPLHLRTFHSPVSSSLNFTFSPSRSIRSLSIPLFLATVQPHSGPSVLDARRVCL